MTALKRTIVRAVTIRRLTARDAPAAVDAVFAGLSAHSRYLRFHSPVPRMTPSLRRALADLDGDRHVAVVAELGDVPVGIGRFVATGDGDAETAVAVVDRWQRHGVGQLLLTTLGDLAADRGHRRLTGSVLPGNTAMLALAARLAPGTRPVRDGDTMRVTVRLDVPADSADPADHAAWTITEADVLADLLAR